MGRCVFTPRKPVSSQSAAASGNLEAAGYRGNHDIELDCPAERMDEEHGQGLVFLGPPGIGRNGAHA